ncbi:hypothetical protein CaCOL14_004505 [Colletotrichum acutatum]
MAHLLLLLLAGLSGGLCQEAPQVQIRNGSYTGVHLPLLNQDYFLGMPFAQPPVQGPLRFSPPASLNISWTGSRDATQFGNICYGYGNDNNRLAALGFKISEDCLSINVVRPSNYTDQSLPVAVYIYGGGYFQGGSADPRLNFSSIIRDSVAAGKPIIGEGLKLWLLELQTLALGIKDWHYTGYKGSQNIAAFGGDPTKVTIFGNSAGAGSVGAQLLAYNGRDDGLFRGAISQSGAPAGFSPFSPFLDIAKWDEVYENITVGTGCNTTDTLDCLRNVPIEVLNAVVNSTATSGASYGLVFDGDFVADAPGAQLAKGNFVKVPYIIGHNTDEGSAFIPGNNFDNATFYPTSKIDTDEQFRDYIVSLKANETVASRVFDLYRQNATDQALATYSDDLGAELGYQYKRAVTLAGDSNIIVPTRYTAQMWAAYNVPLYKYRWDVIVSGLPRYIGATHAKEIFFVFDDQSRDDYDVWPLQGKPKSFPDLAVIMATAWASFVATGDPNSNGSVNGTNWPLYNGSKQNFVFTGNVTSHVENDDTHSGPHHHSSGAQDNDPASKHKKPQQNNANASFPEYARRTAEKLPPPTFIILALLFGLYIIFSSSQQNQRSAADLSSPPVAPSVVTTTIYQEHQPSSTPKVVVDTSPKMSTEQTFIAIKPDGVQRGLIGPIVSRFETRGFKLVAIKLMTPGKEHLQAHYADLKDKPFFAGLIEYMNSGPICAMVWEGRDAVKTGRVLLGATNPLASAPGTIRGDYAIDVGRNVCHGSDSVENAKKEIALWFKDGDVVSYKASQFDWIYEKP